MLKIVVLIKIKISFMLVFSCLFLRFIQSSPLYWKIVEKKRYFYATFCNVKIIKKYFNFAKNLQCNYICVKRNAISLMNSER